MRGAIAARCDYCAANKRGQSFLCEGGFRRPLRLLPQTREITITKQNVREVPSSLRT